MIAYDPLTEDIDAIGDIALPRWRTTLLGHERHEQTVLDAYLHNRLHHAWLICGPEGIGKATFAYRVGRFLLAHPDPARASGLGITSLFVDPSHPVAHKVAQLAHPDLFVLRRSMNPDTGKVRGVIAVDDARAALHRFESTAGAAGWRVVIVDPADDLNPASANALLKMLEEPPPRAIFLIVAHAPQRLLPTIRSRCRRLALEQLADTLVEAVLGELMPATTGQRRADAVLRAQGSPRRALKLLSDGGIELIDQIETVLERLPSIDTREVHGLAERLSRRDAEAAFAVFTETLAQWTATRVRQGVEAQEPLGGLARLAERLSEIGEANALADVYNLDRKQVVLSSITRLAAALGRSPVA